MVAVEEARRIFNNIRKFIRYILLVSRLRPEYWAVQVLSEVDPVFGTCGYFGDGAGLIDGASNDDENITVSRTPQKAFILRQGADGVPVADICRKAGISQATYFNWKKKYEGMQPPEMRRLKQLEDENAKLKKIVADLSLDREMLQDVIRRKL